MYAEDAPHADPALFDLGVFSCVKDRAKIRFLFSEYVMVFAYVICRGELIV